jgi:hypothetical protein
LRGIVWSMLSNLSRRITRRNPNRPAKADNLQTKPDEVVPKAVPKLVPQNAKRPVLIGILQVIGGLLVPRRGNLLHNLSMQ